MRYRLLPVLVGLALLAACASGSASPSGSGTADPSASTPVSAEPTGPSVSVHLLGDGPVLDGAHFGAAFVLPAALTWVDGTYHLWGRTFNEEPGQPSRGYHASSRDGVIWTPSEADPFAEIGLDLADPGAVPGSVLHEPDGSWLMFLWGFPTEGVPAFYRATAAAPEGPWVADLEPILTRTSGGWDGGGLDFPTVVHQDDGYLMLYSAWRLSEPSSNVVGVATSPDGIVWTKGEEPVIRPGLCGAFDARSIALPRLRDIGDGWYLFYNGLPEDQTAGASVGVASSPDLLTWSCASSEPALVASDIPGSAGIHTMAVAADARGPEMLIESLGEGFSELWLGDVEMPAP
jgi:hypothetical protein